MSIEIDDVKSKFDTSLSSLGEIRIRLTECNNYSIMVYDSGRNPYMLNKWINTLDVLYRELWPNLKDEEKKIVSDKRNKLKVGPRYIKKSAKYGNKNIKIERQMFDETYRLCEEYELIIREYLHKKGMLIATQDDPRWAMA